MLTKINPNHTALRSYVRLISPQHSRNLDWWLNWPPDVFALTSMIFKHTGIYIDAVLPPVEQEPWPEAGWPNNLNPEKWEWIEYLVTVGNNEERKLPPKLAERQRIIQSNWHEITIEDLISLTEEEELGNSASKRTHRNRVWQVCKALLELHGLADETCAGFGTLAGHYWEPHY